MGGDVTLSDQSYTRLELQNNCRMPSPRVAVLLPCHNEAIPIARVVADFMSALPEASIYVYDNASTDDTASAAHAAGAIVRHEPTPGKGNVVRRMFADIEADIYIIADGDGTYDTSVAPMMVRLLIEEQLDMIVAVRDNIFSEAHRAGHAIGNRLFNLLYRTLFGTLFTDIFSGYRVLSRRFVKTFPALSEGFEIETEMSVHAGQLRLPVKEIVAPYGTRAEGSSSKLSTIRDSLRILLMFIQLFKEIYPLRYYGGAAAASLLLAMFLGYPLLVTYVNTGLVPRFPTAIGVTGLGVLSGILLTCGLILDSVSRSRREQKRLTYLSLPRQPQ